LIDSGQIQTVNDRLMQPRFQILKEVLAGGRVIVADELYDRRMGFSD
jgi:hypothetical protein